MHHEGVFGPEPAKLPSNWVGVQVVQTARLKVAAKWNWTQVGPGAWSIWTANWTAVPRGQGVRLIGGAKWAQTQFGKGVQEIWTAKSAEGH